MRALRSKARGFTLIELCVVLLMGAALSTTFFGIMYQQNLAFLERLDDVDAHQNGRATINLVRRYIRSANFGFASDANAVGFVTLGQCYKTGAPTATQMNCDNVDSGSDRLRVAFINNDTEFVSSNLTPSSHTCAATATFVDSSKIRVKQNPVTAFASGALAGIGGACMAGGAPSASDLVYINSDSGSGDSGCLHRYVFTSVLGGTQLSCGTNLGYAAGFSFGRATIADFFIGADASSRPQLMMRSDPRTALANAAVVGFDVEDFQVRYGIDTNTPPDRSVDVWCDDLRTSADGGTGACNLTDSKGTALTTAAVYDRIMAVQATVRVRSTSTRPNTLPMPLNPNLTASKPVVNIKDGYQRWLYTTTVMLRNNNI